MFTIAYSKSSLEFIESQSEDARKKIRKAVNYLKNNPYMGNNIKKLNGEFLGLYRYRAGDIRILYEIQQKKLLVSIVKIGYRGSVY